jgi:hypothetical protein
MGAAAAPIAAVSSLASIGLSAMGDVTKSQGINAANQFQADQADRAAEFGRLQAGLTDTTMRERLNTTIANIDAIRASGNVDPSSPTTAAVEDWNRMISDRQRTAAVLSQRGQADADSASARYLRQAGAYALTQGTNAAFLDVAGGLAKGLAPGGALRV